MWLGLGGCVWERASPGFKSVKIIWYITQSFYPLKPWLLRGMGHLPSSVYNPWCLQCWRSSMKRELNQVKPVCALILCKHLEITDFTRAEIWEVVGEDFTIFPCSAIAVPCPSPCSHPASPLLPSSLLQKCQCPTRHIGAPSAHCHSARVPHSLCSPKVSPRSSQER